MMRATYLKRYMVFVICMLLFGITGVASANHVLVKYPSHNFVWLSHGYGHNGEVWTNSNDCNQKSTEEIALIRTNLNP